MFHEFKFPSDSHGTGVHSVFQDLTNTTTWLWTVSGGSLCLPWSFSQVRCNNSCVNPEDVVEISNEIHINQSRKQHQADTETLADTWRVCTDTWVCVVRVTNLLFCECGDTLTVILKWFNSKKQPKVPSRQDSFICFWFDFTYCHIYTLFRWEVRSDDSFSVCDPSPLTTVMISIFSRLSIVLHHTHWSPMICSPFLLK